MQLQMALWASAEACAAEAAAASASLEPWIPRLFGEGKNGPKQQVRNTYTLGSTNIAGWKMKCLKKMYFLFKKDGDIPFFPCYVSLPEGTWNPENNSVFEWLEMVKKNKHFLCKDLESFGIIIQLTQSFINGW